MGCPSEVVIGDNLVFSVATHDPDTGVLTDADAVPSYRVYEDETATPILTGSMAKLDDANTTGFYTELIACTSGNGFEEGKTYTVYIEATVDGDTGGITHAFKAVTKTAYFLGDGAHGGTSATLTLSSLTIANASGDAVNIQATGADGHGIYVLGNGGGEAIHAEGGNTASGVRFESGAAGYYGMNVVGQYVGLYCRSSGADTAPFGNAGIMGWASGGGYGIRSVGTNAAGFYISTDTGSYDLELANGTSNLALAADSKTGFSLAATGLDAITATEPTSKPSTFPGWIMWLVQRFRRSKLTSTVLTVEKEDGTAVTTQIVSDDGTTQQLGAPS